MNALIFAKHPARWRETIAAQQPEQEGEFVRLFAMHSSKVMSFIRVLNMNRQDDAEEVFQRTCMVIWKKFSQYDPSGDFTAWACRIAYYETLKHREAMGRVKILNDEALKEVAEAAIPISAKLSERRGALADCLESLPESQYKLVRQKYFEGETVEEIARASGRSSYAVYRELSKAHGLLFRCVERKTNEGFA